MNNLIIPERISLEKEAIPGVRVRDLPKLAAIAVPGVLVASIVWGISADQPLTQLITMIAIVLYLFFSYAVVARIEGSPSVLDYLGLLVRFIGEQQCFYYKHGREMLTYVAAERSEKTNSTGIH